MKASEWAFDRIKKAFNLVAQDEAEKMSIVQEIMLRRTNNLRRIIAPVGGQGGVTTSFLCPHCNSTFGGGKSTKWWCAICGERYGSKSWQSGERFEQAKVFKAHAVPQGLCANLINALKLLADQQEDGDMVCYRIL